MENPNPEDVTARISYMTEQGKMGQRDVVLPPESLTFLDPTSDVGNVDFSATIECLEGESIAVDRLMRWEVSTDSSSIKTEFHGSIGTTSPSDSWYLAEGSCAWGFECWILVLNPNTQTAGLTLTFMTEEGQQIVAHEQVGCYSRATFNMREYIGEKDASVLITSDAPVVVERSMYRNSRWEGANTIGATEPSQVVLLAEGSTNYGFTTYLLIQNPNSNSANASLTFHTTTGPVAGPVFEIQPLSRKTLCLNDYLKNTDFALEVSSSVSIVAERAMYWESGTSAGEFSTVSMGMTLPHKRIYLPTGGTDGITEETWTLVQNPNESEVEIEVYYLKHSGGVTRFTETIPSHSRRSYRMSERANSKLLSASVVVESKTPGLGIVAENALYYSSQSHFQATKGFLPWTAGAAMTGGWED
ncbi:MAG: hypothetical protein PHO53_05520 [Actinomycetota bacterium]|nr:hypothetical protein [Actinomycetota bacterium]